MKKILITVIVLGIFAFTSYKVFSDVQYNYYVVDSLADGEDLNGCGIPTEKCHLNSAISLAENSSRNTVIMVKIPYVAPTALQGRGQDKFPFYVVREVNESGGMWKIYPAPLISARELNDLHETITDFFFNFNTGVLDSPTTDTFFTTFFFGQFRKFYPETKNINDYDERSPIYRIIELPVGGKQFTTTQEVKDYLKDISTGQLQYQKVFLNGWSLRIYEESLSRAVFIFIFLLTILLVILNLLVFPNIIIYIAVLLQDTKKTKIIGLVYDEESGSPVSFASLRIYKMADGGKTFLKQVISDLDGKYYGFTLSRGKYLFEIQRNDYKTFQQEIEIFEQEGIYATDTPLSKLEATYKKNFFVKIKDWIVINIKTFNGGLITFSLIIAILNIFIAQNIFNLFILIFAGVQFVIFRHLSRRRNWGVVLDSTTNMPIRSAFVKVFNPVDYTQLDVKMTDEQGRFGFILRKSEYLVNVKAFGYKYPSNRDSNTRVTTSSGEVFVKLDIGRSRNLKVYLDKVE